MSTSNLHTNEHSDEFWMSRCLELAAKGLGNVAPNPMVGCVIVYQNRIIGEGYHSEYGHHHAEVNAINSVDNKTLLTKSSLYVNLEPCSHHGKTPPCCDFIAHHQFKKVVIGALDANEVVNGKGAQSIKNRGAKVITGVLQQQCLELNKRFYTFHKEKRPYYTLKWAQTIDGYLYKQDENKQISNALSTQKVHQIRSEEQAILIGEKTLLIDNPSLTVRHVNGKNPIRIVVSETIPNEIENLNIFNEAVPTLFFNTSKAFTKNHVEFIHYEKNQLITSLNKELFKRSITSVLVEGGATTLATFIDSNNWDQAFIITSKKQFNGGTKAPKINKVPVSKFTVGQNNEQDEWQLHQNKFAK